MGKDRQEQERENVPAIFMLRAWLSLACQSHEHSFLESTKIFSMLRKKKLDDNPEKEWKTDRCVCV